MILALRLFFALLLSAAASPSAQADPAAPAEAIADLEARCTADGRHCISLPTYFDDVCTAIHAAAGDAGIDSGFLARLLWKESLFDASAVSPAGALGIAQFMPGTAELRGLEDPFNPAEAIFASANYLAELIRRFGNPGLAAAAYNGGENRMERYLKQDNGILPAETLAYVAAITGRPARVWRDAPPETVDYRLDGETPFLEACRMQAKGRAIREFRDPVPPWGVVVASARQWGLAERLAAQVRRRHGGMLAEAELRVIRAPVPGIANSMRYTVQVPAQSRDAALSFCLRLRTTGAICRIHRN